MFDCKKVCMDNVVPNETVKKVQAETLRKLKIYLSNTFGPMGSYTEIISGQGTHESPVLADYSKDGLKVLKHIVFDSPIEYAIQSEIRDECEYVEHKVGDGTTSTVILSSLIFDGLLEIMKTTSLPPRKIAKDFSEIVNKCKDIILSNKRDVTIEDIHSIAMISTNGNEEVSDNITNIYKNYGFGVNIDLDISNDSSSKLKTYQGLTINEGYSDSAYINDPIKGTCTIHNPHIYAFQDPIDTPEMNMLMEKIIMHNIIEPATNDQDMIPTVIVTPLIGRDGSGVLTSLINMLYKFNASNSYNQKPPIVIITNLAGADEAISSDIERICQCKIIRKYINADIQKKDQESGDAPTEDTIADFYGTCEEVVADSEKTEFINPEDMLNGKGTYNTLIEFLKSELKNAQNNNEDIGKIGMLKRRLKSLESNLVEYYVGGITISDRNALKDLVEDAIKNCASACTDGVGRAANFEGLIAINELQNDKTVNQDIVNCVKEAYLETARILYRSVLPEDRVDEAIKISVSKNNCPFNLNDLLNVDSNTDLATIDTTSGDKVLCSIDTDIEILNSISKIITMMVTSNQCLLQSTVLNRY